MIDGLTEVDLDDLEVVEDVCCGRTTTILCSEAFSRVTSDYNEKCVISVNLLHHIENI